jgi:hypothetical protein
MEIRPPNPAEEAALRQAAHLFEGQGPGDKNFWASFQDFGPGMQRVRLVAEMQGQVVGHLQGAFAQGSGVLEEFAVSTDDGRNEVAQALMEIFEIHCLKKNCETILAQSGMDEKLVKSRGFVFFGSIYLKPLREDLRHLPGSPTKEKGSGKTEAPRASKKPPAQGKSARKRGRT